MNHSQPVTAAPSDVDPNRAPRTISHEQMRYHQDAGTAVLMTERERYRTFVHYDGVWWISDPNGYVEITSAGQNTKLDQWHDRLSNGALWT